uniref:Programmed cell death protein 2 C-terminal domain-containing protein n=1 Tax=Tetradesmus obliquus TaxID=3088 RepID=A0A383VRP2_TETOB|eukprot:jgi/Sobl393_1/3832/SZX67831.1
MSQQQQQQQQVWLGLAGDLVGPSDAPDYYTTKVGGCAVLPGSQPPAEALSGCTCSVCVRPLSLLMQAYAPHSAAPERVLLMLGCTKLGCGKEAGCYKALRCQLPPQQQQQPEEPSAAAAAAPQEPAAAAAPQEPAAAPPAAAVGFDAVSAADDDWGDAGDWGAVASSTVTGTSCAAYDFSDLVQSLEAAGQQAAAAAASKARAKPKLQLAAEASDAAAAGDAAAGEAAACCRVTAGPQLPEFYVYSEAEPGEAGAKSISSKELQHVQQLLAAYEAAEAAAGTTSSTGTSAAPGTSRQQQQAAAAASSADAAAAADEGGSWAGEGYEEDQARGVERGYLKFAKRLARQPKQCARYSLGGPLLWPKASLPQPPPCAACGGPRAFELQLMPSLMQLSIEAAQMALEQHMPVDAAAVDAVANWDWATVAVFTCQASCSSSSKQPQAPPPPPAAAAVDSKQQQQQQQCEVFSEAVFLINEQDCHLALPPPVPGVGAGSEPGAAPSAAVAAAAAAAAPAANDDDLDGEEQASFEDDEEDN